LRSKTAIAFSLFFGFAFGQDPAFERYSNQYVWYSDIGFSTAPAAVRIPEKNGIDKLQMRNNSKLVLGVGFSYKWLTLRLSSGILGNLRPKSRFGTTVYYDLGFDFTVKKRFFIDFDFHTYNGYTYKNAYRWNDTLNELKPNLYDTKFGAASISINTWHFFNADFNMASFRGKTGAYKRQVGTWYLRYTTNIYGIGNENGIIPPELRDSANTKTSAQTLAAFDFGVIPGYGYVQKIRNFQIGVMAGLGFTVQSKFYITPTVSRTFLGLAPRLDIKFVAGWNEPSWFVMFVTDFDNKGIRFNDLSYHQTFYTLRVMAGIRVKKKEKERPNEEEMH